MPGSDGSGSSCDVRIYLQLDRSPTPTAASDPPGPGFLKLMTEFTSSVEDLQHPDFGVVAPPGGQIT